jgi:hypothetical protein
VLQRRDDVLAVDLVHADRVLGRVLHDEHLSTGVNVAMTFLSCFRRKK